VRGIVEGALTYFLVPNNAKAIAGKKPNAAIQIIIKLITTM